MGKQRVEHPTTYKSRMAADRMSVLLVIDRELLAPYTKAAKEAHIDRNSVLVAALKQTIDGKQVNDEAMATARMHNANVDRSASLRARQDAMHKSTSAGSAAVEKEAKSTTKKSAKPAKPVLVKKVKAPAVKAKVKVPAKASAKVEAKAKSAAKLTSKSSKPRPATAEAKAKAKLPIKRAKVDANAKGAAKSTNKAPSASASAKKNAKPSNAKVRMPKRAAGKQGANAHGKLAPAPVVAEVEVPYVPLDGGASQQASSSIGEVGGECAAQRSATIAAHRSSGQPRATASRWLWTQSR